MSHLAQLEEIFAAALEKPPADRPAFLEAACTGDADLRRRLEKMLSAADSAGSFLISPPAVLAIASHDVTDDFCPLTEGPGSRIGPYKLLQQIGEGGFGVVYMAEQQEPVRRKVALKIIKPGMDTKEVIARFEWERQALALMEHPNIAKVLDAGMTGEQRRQETGNRGQLGDVHDLSPVSCPLSPSASRPFFVMELVKGVPITEYCQDAHLSIDERLQLFIQICHAVQHAHLKGIIHRDLKPSNVLVTLHDGKPVPKVIDFGVAKATSQQLTERTLFTAFGQMIGTPAYMSPEQTELSGLDIDTRSDVYSLGVLLYELLTGTTPFDSKTLRAAGFDEMRRIIREEEPETVSTRLAKTRKTGTPDSGLATKSRDPNGRPPVPNPEPRAPRLSELDWIVMKSLEKDRNRRCESASAFAADVQRYLSDEPVLACPPSPVYRFRKFARKHKAAITTVAAIAASLLICTVVSAWQAVEANSARQVATERLTSEQKARREAELQYQRAERERQRAESERQRAESERDRAESHTRKIEEQRQSLENYQRVNALVAKEIIGVVATTSASAVKRHTALLDLLGRLNDLDIEPSQRVTAYHTLGNQFVMLKEFEGALAAFHEGLALDPGHSGIHISRGDLFYRQAQFDRAADDYTAAMKNLRDSDPMMRSLPIARRGHVRAKQGRIDEAMADFWFAYAEYPQQTIELLSTRFLNNHRDLLRFPKLISRSDQLQPLLLALLDRYVADQNQSATALSLRADVLGYLGRFDNARRDYEAAIEKGSISWEPYIALGTLALIRGDSATYRQNCQAMLTKSLTVTDHEFKLMAAYLCTFAPQALHDYQPVIAIARDAVARQPQRRTCNLILGSSCCATENLQKPVNSLKSLPNPMGTGHNTSAPLVLRPHCIGLDESMKRRNNLLEQQADPDRHSLILRGDSTRRWTSCRGKPSSSSTLDLRIGSRNASRLLTT